MKRTGRKRFIGKKTFRSALLSLLCILVFVSCGQNGLPKSSDYSDEYMGDEDFSPCAFSWLNKTHGVTVFDDTLYFIAGNYLFFSDPDNWQTRPLCFKADCLHNDEPEPEKRAECSAFLGSIYEQTFIGHFRDELLFSCLNQKTGHLDIMASKKDGSGRRSVLPNIDKLKQVCLHRGVLYYILSETNLSDETEVSLMAYSLLTPSKKPYEITKYTDKSNIDKLFPYGTNVFFSVTSAYSAGSGDETRLFSYDIGSGNITPLPFDVNTQLFGIYDGKMVIRDEYGYQEYSLKDHGMKSCSWLNHFSGEHPGWWCQFDNIQEGAAFSFCIGEDFQPDYDLYVLDEEGNQVCTLEGVAWGTTTSETVSCCGKDYYISYSVFDPFTVKIYAIEDILAGHADPVTLLEVGSFTDSLTPAYIIQGDGVLPE